MTLHSYLDYFGVEVRGCEEGGEGQTAGKIHKLFFLHSCTERFFFPAEFCMSIIFFLNAVSYLMKPEKIE